jgi:LacI family transcriptional regulator, galactose operon repressor
VHAVVNIREVAIRAGVSAGTVSNVLNRPEIVAPSTRARVQRAIADLGFVPNGTARQLRRGRGRVLGLVVLDMTNPFFTDVARGVDEAASAAGMAVIFCNSASDSAREASYLDLLEEQRVQGVLIAPIGDPSERLLRLRERGILVVLLDRLAGRADLCSVSVDHLLGGELAARHLVESGHRRIAFVGGPFSLVQVRDRFQGALTAVRAAGLAGDCLTPIDTTSLDITAVAAGRDAAGRVLGMPRERRPTAVFCANDLLALGVLQGMTQQRVVVPGEIAIVGYDDVEYAAAAAVPLSSVRQPRQRLGLAAAELLLDEAARPAQHEHRHVILTPELVVRESSRPDR